MDKTCAFCEKTDGMCYTSNPPKRKCTITGKFHDYDHICDVQTNADRIRAMSDEELCKFLTQYKFCDICDEGCDNCTYHGDCDKRLLEWLKQPADEGVNNG